MKRLIALLQFLTIILSPLYILRFHLLIPTTLLEWLILATVFLTLTDFIRNGCRFDLIKTRFDKGILVFLLSALVACLVSFNFIGGLGILKAYFIEPVLFYYTLKYNRGLFSSERVIYSLIFTSFWLAVLSLLQKLTGGFSLAPSEIAQGRVSGVYNSANSLALFIGPVCLILAAFFLKVRSDLKIVYLLLFGFFSLIMVWTKSKGGLIAETLSLVVLTYAMLAKESKLLRKVWPILPLSIVLLITLFLIQAINNYQTHPQDYQYKGSDTLEIRYFLWQGTTGMIKDHAFFGAGLDGFKTLYAGKYRLPQYPEDFQYPHNLILTFWTETGLPGLLSFFYIYILALYLLIKNLMSNKDYILGVGLIAVLCYWLIHGVVDVPYFKNDLSLEFWVVIAMVDSWVTRKSS